MEWCEGSGEIDHLGHNFGVFCPHQQPTVGGKTIPLDEATGYSSCGWAKLLHFSIYLAGVISSIDGIA